MLKTVFVSTLCHVTLLGMFSFSFGNRIQSLENRRVYFWGQLLSNTQLDNLIKKQAAIGKPITFSQKQPEPVVKKIDFKHRGLYLKPSLASNLPAIIKKENFLSIKTVIMPLKIKRGQPVIFFSPLLPYSFVLYFTDRQTAHVELAFKINTSAEVNTVLVERRISSGNLEVDLLSKRYISRYLSMQQASFSPDKWQAVKIDLSREND